MKNNWIPNNIEFGPEDYPSIEDFSNFEEYTYKLFSEERHRNSGCVKVF